MKKILSTCVAVLLMVGVTGCNSADDVTKKELGINSKILRFAVLRSENIVVNADKKADTILRSDLESEINQSGKQIILTLPKYLGKKTEKYEFKPFFVLDNKATITKIAYDAAASTDFKHQQACKALSVSAYKPGSPIQFKFFTEKISLHGSAQQYDKKKFCDVVFTVSPQVGNPTVYTTKVLEDNSNDAQIIAFNILPSSNKKLSNNQLKNPMVGKIDQVARTITFDSVAYDLDLKKMVPTLRISDKHARILISQNNYIIPFSVVNFSQNEDFYESKSDSTINFESVLYFTARSERGTNFPYKVNIPKKADPRSNQAKLLSMEFKAKDNKLLEKDVKVFIDPINNTYSVTLPFPSFKLTEDLIPTITISDKASSTVVTGNPMDFRDSKSPIIVVTSENERIRTTYNLLGEGVIFNDTRSVIARISKYEFVRKDQHPEVQKIMAQLAIDKFPNKHPDDQITSGNSSGLPEKIIMNMHWRLFEYLEGHSDIKLVPDVEIEDDKAKLVNAINPAGYAYFLPGQGGGYQTVQHVVQAERQTVYKTFQVEIRKYVNVNQNANISTLVLSKDDYPAYKWSTDLTAQINQGTRTISITVPFKFDYTKFKPTIVYEAKGVDDIHRTNIVKRSLRTSAADLTTIWKAGDDINLGSKDYAKDYVYSIEVVPAKTNEPKKYTLVVNERSASNAASISSFSFVSKAKPKSIAMSGTPQDDKGDLSMIVNLTLGFYHDSLKTNHQFDYTFNESQFSTINLMKLESSKYVVARKIANKGEMDLRAMKDTLLQVVSQSETVKTNYRIRYKITPTDDVINFTLTFPGRNNPDGTPRKFVAVKSFVPGQLKKELTITVPKDLDYSTTPFNYTMNTHPDAVIAGALSTNSGKVLLNTNKEFMVTHLGISKSSTYLIKVVKEK